MDCRNLLSCFVMYHLWPGCMSVGLKDPHLTLISLALACKLWKTGPTQVSFTLDSRWFNCTRTLAFQLCVSSRSNNVIKRNPWQITMSGDAPSDNPLLFMDAHWGSSCLCTIDNHRTGSFFYMSCLKKTNKQLKKTLINRYRVTSVCFSPKSADKLYFSSYFTITLQKYLQ